MFRYRTGRPWRDVPREVYRPWQTLWNMSADEFVVRVHGEVKEEPLAMVSTYLRADRNLTPSQAAALDSVIRATYDALRRA